MPGLYLIIAVIAALLLPSAASRAQLLPQQPQISQPAQQPAVCPETRAPVCAIKFGQRLTYWNACKARADRADVVSEGEFCPTRDVGGN